MAIDQELTQTPTAVTNNLADILERVLDKGIVIAGDIRIQLADMDLLNIKIRLLITSVDRAKELGIDWWKTDPFYSSLAEKMEKLEGENRDLRKMLKETEAKQKIRQPAKRAQKLG